MRDFAIGNIEGDADTVARAADGFWAMGIASLALDAQLFEIEISSDGGGDLFHLRRRALVARLVASRMRPHPSPRASARLGRISAQLDLPSDRQIEIARLVASGCSSKEVASELIVSARTVDNHLAAVYRNLGISSRAELSDLPL